MKKKILPIAFTLCLSFCIYGCNSKETADEAQHKHIVTENCMRLMETYQYNSFIYDYYSNSTDTTELLMSEYAKNTANNIAETYNSYVTEFNFVFGGLDNFPEDLKLDLSVIE